MTIRFLPRRFPECSPLRWLHVWGRIAEIEICYGWSEHFTEQEISGGDLRIWAVKAGLRWSAGSRTFT